MKAHFSPQSVKAIVGRLWNRFRPHRRDKKRILLIKAILYIIFFFVSIPIWIYLFGLSISYLIYTRIKIISIAITLVIIVMLPTLFIGSAWAAGSVIGIYDGITGKVQASNNEIAEVSSTPSSTPTSKPKPSHKPKHTKPKLTKSKTTPSPTATPSLTSKPTLTPSPIVKATNTAIPTSKPNPSSSPTSTPFDYLANDRKQENDFKASTTDTTVETLYKDGNLDEGTDIHFTAQIVNFVNDSFGYPAGANVTAVGSYDGDIIQVSFSGITDVTQINQGDTIEVWGIDNGEVSGTNAFGASVSEVSISEKYLTDQTTNYSDGWN